MLCVCFGQMMWMNNYQRQRLPNPKRRRKQRKAVKAGAANDKKSSERLAEHLFSLYICVCMYVYFYLVRMY